MGNLISDLMRDFEDVDFILSKETACEFIKGLLEDGMHLGVEGEEQSYDEAFDEIENSVAVIVSQVLLDEGYCYFVQNYLSKDGTPLTIENEKGEIFIEDTIDDLVDFSKLSARNIVIIGEEDEFIYTLEDIYEELIEDLDNSKCVHCSIMSALAKAYELGYNDIIKEINSEFE